MPAIMETWTSPKFITCPDCGERYDHAKRRRLIDTCGHPRCYACLFIDNPCPLCLKLPISPRSRSTSFNIEGFRGSHESLLIEAAKKRAISDPDTKHFKGSHPNLSELHKMRSATMPQIGFRRDNYFRSLYKYDPSSQSQESLTDQSTENLKEVKPDRPRSINLPNYHTSLENLHEKFWKSVKRTSRPGSPTSPANNLPTSPLAKARNSASPDCPIYLSDDDRLAVPGARPRSRTSDDSPWEDGATRQSLTQVPHRTLGPRPCSASDLQAKLKVEAAIQNELSARRSFRNDNQRGPNQQAISSSPPQLRVDMIAVSPSDRSSDASSVRISDSWSESSGEDEIIFPKELCSQTEKVTLKDTHCKSKARVHERFDETGNVQEKQTQAHCKKSVYNSFASTTYWVVEPSQSNSESPHASEKRLVSSEPLVYTNGDVRTKVSTF